MTLPVIMGLGESVRRRVVPRTFLETTKTREYIQIRIVIG